MKLQLFASTAAVLFSAFSGSVSATSLRGVSTTCYLFHHYIIAVLALAGVSLVLSVEVVGSLRRSYDSGVAVNDAKQSQLKISGYAPAEEGDGFCVDSRGEYYTSLGWYDIASLEDCKTHCISVKDKLPTDWPFRGIDYELGSICYCLFDTIDDEEGMRTNQPKCTDLNPSMDGCFDWESGSLYAGYGAVESIASAPWNATCVPWIDESERS